MNRPKRIEPGERIPVRLTERDRELILNHTFIGGDLERRIRIASVEGSAAVVGLTLDDLDDLIGHVGAEANHSKDLRLGRQLDRLWNRLREVEDGHTDEDLPAPTDSTIAPPEPGYTTKQGQYLAFIHYYTRIHGHLPSEAEMQRHFRVSPPAVHEMVSRWRRAALSSVCRVRRDRSASWCVVTSYLTLSSAATALLLEWYALHREELRDNWERARSRKRLQKIEPLE